MLYWKVKETHAGTRKHLDLNCKWKLKLCLASMYTATAGNYNYVACIGKTCSRCLSISWMRQSHLFLLRSPLFRKEGLKTNIETGTTMKTSVHVGVFIDSACCKKKKKILLFKTSWPNIVFSLPVSSSVILCLIQTEDWIKFYYAKFQFEKSLLNPAFWILRFPVTWSQMSNSSQFSHRQW